jgi:hypothetical protein
MSDTKKKVDESWKDKVESEKADAEREEHKEEQKPPEGATGQTEGAAGQKEDTAGQEPESSAAQSADAQSADEPAGFPPLEAGFITLVADLAMQASLFMGEIPNPETNEPIEDLNRAKYLIDILGVLEEKTKGNLTPEEQGSLKNVLYELRMTFVAKTPKP